MCRLQLYALRSRSHDLAATGQLDESSQVWKSNWISLINHVKILRPASPSSAKIPTLSLNLSSYEHPSKLAALILPLCQLPQLLTQDLPTRAFGYGINEHHSSSKLLVVGHFAGNPVHDLLGLEIRIAGHDIRPIPAMLASDIRLHVRCGRRHTYRGISVPSPSTPITAASAILG